MKTTLVNHSGVIQEKFIIRTIDDLYEYEKVNAYRYGSAVIENLDKPNRLRDLLELNAENSGNSVFMSALSISMKQMQRMLEHIQNEKTIVVNMAGGYTFWDDSIMSLVDESERKNDDSEYLPKVNIGKNKVLILENQESVPKSVIQFVTSDLQQKEYSSIIRLNTDYNNNIGSWIKEALKMGCDTIVTETQLMDRKQIKNIASLFEHLPPMTFYVFGNTNLKAILTECVGEDKTAELHKKHKIIN
jgi:hypothetical protein